MVVFDIFLVWYKLALVCTILAVPAERVERIGRGEASHYVLVIFSDDSQARKGSID